MGKFAHAVGLIAKYWRRGNRWIIVQLIVHARDPERHYQSSARLLRHLIVSRTFTPTGYSVDKVHDGM